MHAVLEERISESKVRMRKKDGSASGRRCVEDTGRHSCPHDRPIDDRHLVPFWCIQRTLVAVIVWIVDHVVKGVRIKRELLRVELPVICININVIVNDVPLDSPAAEHEYLHTLYVIIIDRWTEREVSPQS